MTKLILCRHCKEEIVLNPREGWYHKKSDFRGCEDTVRIESRLAEPNNHFMTDSEYKDWENGNCIKIGDYAIKPKRDFSEHGYLIDGVHVKAGWVVIKDHALATPGGGWDCTIRGATKTVGLLMASKGDADVFHGLSMALI